jgi:hypothetical protein
MKRFWDSSILFMFHSLTSSDVTVLCKYFIQVSAGCAGSPCAFGCTSLGGNSFQCGCPTGYQRIGQVRIYFCINLFVYNVRIYHILLVYSCKWLVIKKIKSPNGFCWIHVIKICNFKVTNSMALNTTREATSCPVSWEITSILWKQHLELTLTNLLIF